MTKLSPLARVKKEHGSKEKLAKKVMGIIEAADGEEASDFEARVQTMSNSKLLRLWEAHNTLTDKYGSKADLAAKITAAKFKGANADYTAKISGFSAPKLLDLARQYKI